MLFLCLAWFSLFLHLVAEILLNANPHTFYCMFTLVFSELTIMFWLITVN